MKPEIARLDVQSGQAQVALGLTPNQADSISGSTKIYKAPSTTVYYLQANANPSVSALASNRHLWQAIRYALDYPNLVHLAGGGAVQACGVVPRQFLGALPAGACVKQNIAKAKSELAAAGVSNPSLTLEFPSDFTLEGVSFTTMAQAVQSDLKKIGLDVTLQGAPLATWLPRWMKGIQQLNQGALAALYPDPNMTEAYLPTGYRGAYAGYKPTDAPQLTKLGLQAQQEINPAKRAALYRQAPGAAQQRLAVHPAVPAERGDRRRVERRRRDRQPGLHHRSTEPHLVPAGSTKPRSRPLRPTRRRGRRAVDATGG